MAFRRQLTRQLCLAAAVTASLASAATVNATPNLSQLHEGARGLLQVHTPPNPCDDVWHFLAVGSDSLSVATSAVVSIRQSYAVAGLSTLAPVRPDDAGRYAMNAPLMLGEKDGLGHVDVRFSRRPGPAEQSYLYSVQVQTCTGSNHCGDVHSHISTPVECSTRRDSATVVVPGASARQEVRIRYSR